jgi:hypothetical protein
MPKPRTPEETYGPALDKARQAFAHIEPQQTAAHAAVAYEPSALAEPDGSLQPAGLNNGRFLIPFLGTLYHVTWPDGHALRAADGQEADIATRILLLHYLLTADGTPMVDRWIAFRNLPGGMGYDAAFQGRANQRLARTFGTDPTAFEAAARALGGQPLAFGDAAFMFRLLPRVWLGIVLYLADDEFPASANVLFDASASHYLATEDLAVLGGLLAGRLIKAARTRLPGSP